MLGNFFFSSTAAAGYTIDQSLRFNNDSMYLYRTPSSAGNRQTWTYSVWIKRCLGGTWPHYHGIFSANNYIGNGWDLHGIEFNGPNATLKVLANVSDITQFNSQSIAKYRDPSAWMHVVVAFNTTSGTSSERLKIWANGVLVATTGSLPALNFSGRINTTSQHRIGSSVTSGEQHCYMAEAHFVDGQALDPTDFGEYDNNGVWRPIRYTGSHGTNGFYLTFDPSATNGIGHDHSGNGNNWTANNFTTSGTGTDVMSDTPTTNWCTLNPLTTSNATRDPSDGNLVIAFGGTYPTNVLGTFGMSSGKWYWEVGFAGADASYGHACGVGVGDWSNKNVDPQTVSSPYHHIIDSRQWFRNSGTNTSNSTGFDPGDIIGIALDVDNDQISFYKNGTIVGSAQSLETGQTWFPLHKNSTAAGSLTQTANFGQRAFEYTPPTGFKALNTSNLPAPTVKDGSDYFEAVTYTGDGNSTQQITTSFEPDFVWNKNRGVAYSHRLFDRLRGTLDKALYSNATYYEDQYTDYGEITATSATSVTVGQGGDSGNLINAASNTYVMWNWLAGGSGSSNTDGSITSTVSANPTAGFSIVSYTGTGSAATVGHGLGVAPSFVVIKNRTDGGYHWYTYHPALTSQYYLRLNDTTAQLNGASDIYPSAPSSTVVNLGGSTGVNGLSKNYIAYCFAEVEGYSKFGSYTGNGSNDGPFVYLGFRPALVLTKRTNSTSNWVIQDSSRQTYNPSDAWLRPNTADVEGTTSPDLDLDFLSNGFKVRNNGTDNNISGSTYIFAAFAEHPTGGSGVSPATAR